MKLYTQRFGSGILLTLMFLFVFHFAQAQVEVGKTYRIVSLAAPTMSLITQNSSLESNANIVLWAETDVASQQWTLSGTLPETTTLRNAYSRLTFGLSKTAEGGTARQGGTGGRWTLEAVNENENIYKFQQKSNGLYLTAIADEHGKFIDGSVPQMAAATDDLTQQWKLIEVEPKTTFTAAMREEMMDAYVKKAVESVGSNRQTFGKGGWGEAEQLEVVLDAYETTGRADYLTLAKNIYNYFNANVGTSWNKLVYTDSYHWFGHDFNDDVMWQIMAVARLGLLTGGGKNNSYIRAAKKNFDIIYNRAYIPEVGLMRWAESSGDPWGTNSCIAGPTEVAACYLGFAGCGEEYFDKARELYQAQRYALASNMATGKIWDSVVWNPETMKVKSKNEWASTYNQGTMLGAACMLYKYYGETKYLSDARKIMSWTKSNLCDSKGIVNVCQGGDNHDLYGFKGILMRYVRRFARDCKQDTYKEWLLKNALHAYCNRSTEGVTSTAWLQKGTAENTSDDFGCSTAASAAVNVILDDDPALPYEEAPQYNAISQLWQEPLFNGMPKYYDLSGRCVMKPTRRGTYIVCCGGKNSKIIVQ
ncbi:MAG: glycoside hydrolase family 76 protein [Bacteroidaceae bacterium]|nr:glycoside hydrolase family 76 protein [Bacteroidaceae bacterium]